jgi:hypothetical protein
MKPPRLSEEALQEIVAAWLDLWGICWTHFPAGGLRHKAVAAKLKRAGTKKGVPDILVFEPWDFNAPHDIWHPARAGFGLAIELKTKGSYPRPEQREWLAALEARGWRTAVCRSLEEVQKACKCLRPINGRQAPY